MINVFLRPVRTNSQATAIYPKLSCTLCYRTGLNPVRFATGQGHNAIHYSQKANKLWKRSIQQGIR